MWLSCHRWILFSFAPRDRLKSMSLGSTDDSLIRLDKGCERIKLLWNIHRQIESHMHYWITKCQLCLRRYYRMIFWIRFTQHFLCLFWGYDYIRLNSYVNVNLPVRLIEYTADLTALGRLVSAHRLLRCIWIYFLKTYIEIGSEVTK